MPDTGENRLQRFLIALLVGGALGAVVGLAIRLGYVPIGFSGSPGANALVSSSVVDSGRDAVAWEYARAFQEGDWSRIVELTLWMEDRLDFVARTGAPESVVLERDHLIAQLSSRELADNQLEDEGLEDQYVFSPGATLTIVSDDEGRSDLDVEVARRTWFRVSYPARDRAPLDRDGLPIQSMNVGVNVSQDGRVLKAGVVGNLDIDWDSIRYDWPSK